MVSSCSGAWESKEKGVPFSNMDNLRNCRITDIQPKRIHVLRCYAFEIQDQAKPTCGRRNQNDGLSLVKMMILAQCEGASGTFLSLIFYCGFRNMFLLWEFINCTLKICVLFYMCTRPIKWQNLTKAGNTSWTFMTAPKVTYFLKINMHTHTHTYKP